MPNTTSPYTRADAAIAVILAVITLLLSVGLLDSDQPILRRICPRESPSPKEG